MLSIEVGGLNEVLYVYNKVFIFHDVDQGKEILNDSVFHVLNWYKVY